MSVRRRVYRVLDHPVGVLAALAGMFLVTLAVPSVGLLFAVGLVVFILGSIVRGEDR